MGIEAYQNSRNISESPRQTEYRAFAEATRGMVSFSQPGTPEFLEALFLNKQLWITLQADLASDGNQLPDELKASLISISIWVMKYTSKVMRGEAPIDPLINVNRTIMQGLVDNPQEG